VELFFNCSLIGVKSSPIRFRTRVQNCAKGRTEIAMCNKTLRDQSDGSLHVILTYRANHGIRNREDIGLEQKGDHEMLNIGIF
jgi:hypothetical protein